MATGNTSDLNGVDVKPSEAIMSEYDKTAHELLQAKPQTLQFVADDITALSVGDQLRTAVTALRKLPPGWKWQVKKPSASDEINSAKVATTGSSGSTVVQLVKADALGDNLVTYTVANTNTDNTYIVGVTGIEYFDGGEKLALNLDSKATGAAGALTVEVNLVPIFKPTSDSYWEAA